MEEIYDETISDSEIDDILGIENDPVEGDVAEDEVDQPEDGDNPDKSEAAKVIKSPSIYEIIENNPCMNKAEKDKAFQRFNTQVGDAFLRGKNTNV